jgi:hydroxypyruvate isomerase
MMKPEDMSLDDFVGVVAEIGFPALEIWKRDESFDELMGLCRRHGLVLSCMSGCDSMRMGLNDEGEHDRLEAELRESIDIAARHGIPGLICLSGQRREGVGDEEAAGITARGLCRVAPYVEEKGVNLILELLNTKIDHPGHQADSTAFGLDVCRRVRSPRVKLLYDIYHMRIMGDDVSRTIRENIGHIGHFHTAGVPGRGDIDETQDLDYAAICATIGGAGYEGYVGHEFQPKGNVGEALRRAFDICDREATA